MHFMISCVGFLSAGIYFAFGLEVIYFANFDIGSIRNEILLPENSE